MPRGVYSRGKGGKKQPAETSTAVTNVNQLVPASSFTNLSWWAKLNQTEQSLVQTEGVELAKALINHGYSKLAIGEHLVKLRGVLEPHRLFDRFLKNFHFSKRTAYRYIAGYENAKARLPEPILKAAMARGMAIIGDSELKPLGVYTKAVAALPPPTNPDDKQANTYLDQLDDVRRKTSKEVNVNISIVLPVPQDPDTLLKECYRFVHVRYNRLPNNSKVRSRWVHALAGMMLSELGVSNVQTISPIAIPDDFRAQRGRPRELQATA